MILIDKNIYIPDEIAALEANLLNNDELSPVDMASIKEELFEYEHIWDLWTDFGKTPIDKKTECIMSDWHEFPKGTRREDIYRWFEEHFNISVTGNLMGQYCRHEP